MLDVAYARDLVARVPDPEIPVITIAELGILRAVEVDERGGLVVTITPTYSGCPALEMIRDEIARAVQAAGFVDVEVRTTLRPPWTTDWISEEGRRKLHEFGIAPPEPRGTQILVQLTAACPQCGSLDTRQISRFGSTACKAHHVCNVCKEPFDRFKTLR